IRCALASTQAAVPLHLLESIPTFSSGMLLDGEGLPSTTSVPDYPICSVSWSGLLVDDTASEEDVVARSRHVFEVLWGERAYRIEQEACDLLGIKDLRDYFRRSGKGGFWDDHITRYSESRRNAPIYWLLQSSKRSYALWLYYQRFDKDLLFKALVNHVEP